MRRSPLSPSDIPGGHPFSYGALYHAKTPFASLICCIKITQKENAPPNCGGASFARSEWLRCDLLFLHWLSKDHLAIENGLVQQDRRMLSEHRGAQHLQREHRKRFIALVLRLPHRTRKAGIAFIQIGERPQSPLGRIEVCGVLLVPHAVAPRLFLFALELDFELLEFIAQAEEACHHVPLQAVEIQIRNLARIDFVRHFIATAKVSPGLIVKNDRDLQSLLPILLSADFDNALNGILPQLSLVDSRQRNLQSWFQLKITLGSKIP